MSSSPPDPARDGWVRGDQAGFIDLVGPIWNRADDPVRFGFLAEPKHVNAVGIVQGGMLMTFADRALGILAWRAAGRSVVTIDFHMMFAGAAQIGRFVECRGAVLRRTRDLVFMRGELLDGARLLATAQGIWKVIDRPPPADARP